MPAARPRARLARASSALAHGAVFALVLASVASCGKSVGNKCKPGEAVCENPTTLLSCQNAKLAEVACRGPLGCTMYKGQGNCDDSIASEGDACVGQVEEEYACSVDKKRALICKNKRFAVYLECRGKAGCALLGQQVSCDTSVAAKGDPCKVQGSSACAVDQKEMLICRDGRFAHYRFCRGQAGCYAKDDAPACDETLSLEGDECGLPGYVVCAVDGQSELICQGGRFVRSRPCRNGCALVAGGRGGIDCR
jgi:hypothetical protein